MVQSRVYRSALYKPQGSGKKSGYLSAPKGLVWAQYNGSRFLDLETCSHQAVKFYQNVGLIVKKVKGFYAVEGAGRPDQQKEHFSSVSFLFSRKQFIMEDEAG